MEGLGGKRGEDEVFPCVRVLESKIEGEGERGGYTHHLTLALGSHAMFALITNSQLARNSFLTLISVLKPNSGPVNKHPTATSAFIRQKSQGRWRCWKYLNRLCCAVSGYL